MEEGKTRKEVSGTPQGGVISPLLANIYLDSFDHKIEKSGFKLVRYADDFVILTKTVNESGQAMHMARDLVKSLGLKLAEEKSGIKEYRQGFDFLGYRFQKYRGNYKWPGKKAMAAFKDKVKRLTRRQQPRNARQVIQNLNPVIRGWGNYFKFGNSINRFKELDSFIRRRLRSFIAKKYESRNWRYPNEFLRKEGLISLSEILAKRKAVGGCQRQMSFLSL